MPTENLTTAKIKAYRYSGDAERGTRDVRWDGGADGVVKGLGLRIYPSGKKSFVLSYRARGSKRLMVLGNFGADLTLDQARTRARKYLVAVRDGTNPLEEKRAAGRGKTFGDLVNDYLERHVEAGGGLKTADQIKRRLKRHLPAPWMSRNADAIEGWEVEDLYIRIGKTRPYEANRLVELLRSMYRQAARWKYIDPAAPNPAVGFKKFTEHKRKRWLTPEELPALATAIDAETNIYVRAALWLYLLTGVRKSELLQARWNDVDWDRGTLKLADTKSGEEQQAALSGAALAILQSIPRLDRNPHILPGSLAERHLVNIGRPWRRVRERATIILWSEHNDPTISGLVKRLTGEDGQMPAVADVQAAASQQGIELPVGTLDVRLHDLRRTVGSWLSQHGADLNLVKDALRHASISTTLIYARLGADPAREAMEDHGRRILEAAGRRGPKEVINGNAT